MTDLEKMIHSNNVRMTETLRRYTVQCDREIAEVIWLHKRIEGLMESNEMLTNEIKRLRSLMGLKEGESGE